MVLKLTKSDQNYMVYHVPNTPKSKMIYIGIHIYLKPRQIGLCVEEAADGRILVISVRNRQWTLMPPSPTQLETTKTVPFTKRFHKALRRIEPGILPNSTILKVLKIFISILLYEGNTWGRKSLAKRTFPTFQ